MNVPAMVKKTTHGTEVDNRNLAVSESELVGTRENALRNIFGSSSIFLAPGFKPDRPDLRGDLIIKNKVNEHYEAGVEAMSNSQFARAVTCLSKAINLQPDQSQLYVDRAEAYLQLCDFQSAALSYRQACFMEPQATAFYHRLAFIYYMQGQCLYDQGMFLDALECFAKAAELKPGCRSYQMRSLACLTGLGRHSDCLRLVSSWLQTDTQVADLFTLRARLHRQLNQVTLCYHDLKLALRLSPSCPEAHSLLRELEEAGEQSHQQAVSKAVEGELPEALGKINTALEHNPERPQYYLFRGILYRRLKDFTAAIEDLVLTVDLSDVGDQDSGGEEQEVWRSLQGEAQAQLVLTYNDFAVHCFSRGFYGEAATLLGKAIEEQREESGLFINRGDSFFKQGEWDFALADYQQAEDMDPDNKAIWLRLAVIHNTLGLQSYEDRKYQEAVDRFSVAIKYNPGVTRYYENRAKAHRKVPNVEGAKQDAISTLILDPTNDQVVPLLLSLLPGCSLSDVMSSQAAQTGKAQLMESIQACRQTEASVSRLSSELDLVSLASDTDSQSEEEDPETRLKPCVSPQEVHQMLVRRQQVNRAVKMALHQRQPLVCDRPRLVPLRSVLREKPALGGEQRPYTWRNFGGFGLSFR